MARRPVAAALADLEESEQDDALDLQGVDDENDEDTGGADDEEDELAADGGEDDDQPEPEPRRRQQRRQDPDDDGLSPAARARLEAAERRAEAAEREARETRQRYEQRTEPQETPEQEAARIALMTPAEIVQHQDRKLERALERHSRAAQQQAFQSANAADKASFETFVANHPSPAVRGLAADVERKHAEMLAAGTNPTRQQVLTFMLGERTLKLSGKPGKANDERRQRVQRQQTRPTNAGSDVGRGGRRPQTAEDRLANVLI